MIRQKLFELVRRILIRLGAPENRSPVFYFDLGLSVPFIFSTLVAVSLAFEKKFNMVFAMALLVSAGAVLLATNKRPMLAALLLFAAARCVLTFFFSQNAILLVVAGFCAAASYMLIATDRTDYPSN